MNSHAPIGIFDSGLGGLTVVKRVCERLPGESIIYLGDQIHVPYGEKSAEEICRYALGITDFLIAQGSKLVIMACNMSTATALEAVQDAFPHTSVIGVIEAGARTAIREAHEGPIGVLATTGTVSTRAYTKALRGLQPGVQVIEQPCPDFVPLVESGRCDTSDAEDAVRRYVEPLLAEGCRTLLLGCTHYPYLMETISRVAGPDVVIIDPAEETAVEAANILSDAGELNPPATAPARRYYTTACPNLFAKMGGQFIDMGSADVKAVEWGSELGAIEWQEKMVAQTTNSAR